MLYQYPNVSVAERQEVAAFLKVGPHADVAKLETDQQLRSKLNAFRKDHQEQFRSGLDAERLMIWFSAMVAVGAGVWLLAASSAA